MPWWGWALGVVAVLGALLVQARRAYRAGVRRQLLETLRRAYPDLRVANENQTRILLRSEAFGEVEVRLHSLYWQIARAPAAEAREEAIRRFCSALHEHAASGGRLSLDRHGARLLPRLLPLSMLESLPPDATPPHLPLGAGGLAVTYVLDSAHSVAYLTPAQLRELGLTVDALHDLAMENLERTFPEEALRDVLSGKSLVLVRKLDGHDAARVLCVPRRLAPGQAVAALVPDVNTLALAPVPADGDWSELRKACVAGEGKPVLNRPLRVTCEGFEAAAR